MDNIRNDLTHLNNQQKWHKKSTQDWKRNIGNVIKKEETFKNGAKGDAKRYSKVVLR